MGNKNYTKYSENSNNDKHIVNPELEESVLKAGGEVMRANPEVIEGNNNVEPIVTPDVTEGDNNITPTEENNNVEPIVTPDVTEGDNTATPDVTEGNDNVDPSQETIELAIVVNCAKLNVREKPSKDAKVLCVLNKDAELTVAIENSTEDFYKVYCSSNDVLFVGYCVKNFIEIK